MGEATTADIPMPNSGVILREAVLEPLGLTGRAPRV
jgi:hypothetical protein